MIRTRSYTYSSCRIRRLPSFFYACHYYLYYCHYCTLSSTTVIYSQILFSFFFHNCLYVFFFFFFSSRRRHTRSDRDWSSDVCSSDLAGSARRAARRHSRDSATAGGHGSGQQSRAFRPFHRAQRARGPRRAAKQRADRSEERRVGKECRSRWSPYH